MAKVKRPAKRINPKFLLIYGPPKVGKSSMMSKLDDCLHIDMEGGADFLTGYIREPKSIGDLTAIAQELKVEGADKYKYGCIDTVDVLANWCEKWICQSHNVKNIADLEYGKGHALARDLVMKYIELFKGLFTEGLIVIGHRKKTLIGEQGTISVETLDLTGKLKNYLCSDADAIGYVYWTKEGEHRLSFRAQQDSRELGGRCDHLIDQDIPFDWSKIYT